jgi:ATP-dependent RNA helicase MSS116
MTEGMGLETMTEVQSKTINSAIKGTDIIAQAKTGTGKTVAFLLPVLQNIINVDPDLAKSVRGRRGPRSTADDIRALIISPTRELAEQIADEAKKLVSGTGIIVQTAVGGTQKSMGLRAIQREGCHILVGTPGRLKDILSDPYTRVEAPIVCSTRVSGLRSRRSCAFCPPRPRRTARPSCSPPLFLRKSFPSSAAP